MNPETLERLLIDRHLGELPPEVCELVDAYLAQDPTTRELQCGIRNVINLARQAVQPAREEDDAALPPLPRVLISRPRAEKRRFGAWLRNGALAAAIVLAFFVGTRLNPPPAPSSAPRGLTDILAEAAAAARPPEDGFWTMSSIEKRTSRVTRDGQHIGWSAPFSPFLKGERS